MGQMSVRRRYPLFGVSVIRGSIYCIPFPSILEDKAKFRCTRIKVLILRG